MSEDTYRATLAQIKAINTIVMGGPTDEELAQFIRDSERADTLGPLLDPTAWMRAHDNAAAVTIAARALADHRRALRRAIGREP